MDKKRPNKFDKTHSGPVILIQRVLKQLRENRMSLCFRKRDANSSRLNGFCSAFYIICVITDSCMQDLRFLGKNKGILIVSGFTEFKLRCR